MRTIFRKRVQPKTKFKWWWCAILGVVTIIDGITMLLTLGWFSTSLQFRFALYGATKNIYRKSYT